MGVYTQLGKVPMLFLVATAIFAAKSFLFDNRLFAEFQSVLEARSPKLPDSNIPLLAHITGIRPLDRQLSTFAVFFWPAINGKFPQISLQMFHFFGQLVPAWLLILVEGFRVGNAWRPISFITIWMLLIENGGAMLFVPIWCLLYLTMSQTTINTSSAKVRRTVLLVHPVELQVIPWSVLVGLGIPCLLILNLNPAPQTPFWAGAQFWIALRQFHPIFTAVTHLILSVATRSVTSVYESPRQRDLNVAASLRRLYSLATLISSTTHAITVATVVTPIIFPKVFATPYGALFDARIMLKPYEFWNGVPLTRGIAEEVGKFLQWDEIISTGAFLLWAFVLNRNSLIVEKKGSGFINALSRTALLTFVGGPITAAISLIAERDDVVLTLSEDEDADKKVL